MFVNSTYQQNFLEMCGSTPMIYSDLSEISTLSFSFSFFNLLENTWEEVSTWRERKADS